MDFDRISHIYNAYKSRDLMTRIHPDDQMWESGPDWYWSVGESGLRCVLGALSLSWQADTRRILDLPCGHGRVTRHLRAAFPDQQIFACDLDHGGVDFCAEEFGAMPVHSKAELTEVGLPEALDVIWIGSLFTHIDEARTTRWLHYLSDHLAPQGVIVASFHGLFSKQLQSRVPMINDVSWGKIVSQYETSGFGYSPYTEHDMGDYGVSLSSPSKILDIATSIEETRVLAYTERGWANNHDILVLTKNDRLAEI